MKAAGARQGAQPVQSSRPSHRNLAALCGAPYVGDGCNQEHPSRGHDVGKPNSLSITIRCKSRPTPHSLEKGPPMRTRRRGAECLNCVRVSVTISMPGRWTSQVPRQHPRQGPNERSRSCPIGLHVCAELPELSAQNTGQPAPRRPSISCFDPGEPRPDDLRGCDG
jgi:hypothetical protein